MDFLMFSLGSILTGIAILVINRFSLPMSEVEREEDPRDELMATLIRQQGETQREMMSLIRTLTVHQQGAGRTATILASADGIGSEIRQGTRPGEIRHGHEIPANSISNEEEIQEQKEKDEMQETASSFMGMGANSQKHMSMLASQFKHIRTPDGGTMTDP